MRTLIFLLLFPLVTHASIGTLNLAREKGYVLSEQEEETLQIGHIDDGSYIGGIAAGWFVGFGLGHVVQNRWQQDGQIFTWGELAGSTALMVGAVGCLSSRMGKACTDGQQGLMIGGLIVVLGLRLWETLDLIIFPHGHNNQLLHLQQNIMTAPEKKSVKIVPLVDPDFGQGLGVVATF